MLRKDKIPKMDEVFFPEGEELITLSGERFLIPKVTWGKEIQVGHAIGRVMEKLKDVRAGTKWNIDKLIPQLLQYAPKEVTHMVAILLEKEDVWVEQNLNSDQIMGILLPFFMSRITMLTKHLPKNLQKMM